MNKKKVREPEPAQGPRKIPERIRTQRAGPERTKPERTGPGKAGPGRVKASSGADAQLRLPAVRKARARSCPRDRDRDQDRGRTTSTGREVQGATPRRTRSSSTAAPKPPGRWTGTDPVQRDQRVRTEDRWTGTDPVQRRSVRTEQSHKAFTVIPPNPKKRSEIQRKAEAELAALEELRLSRATAFVSINPSSVGEAFRDPPGRPLQRLATPQTVCLFVCLFVCGRRLHESGGGAAEAAAGNAAGQEEAAETDEEAAAGGNAGVEPLSRPRGPIRELVCF